MRECPLGLSGIGPRRAPYHGLLPSNSFVPEPIRVYIAAIASWSGGADMRGLC